MANYDSDFDWGDESSTSSSEPGGDDSSGSEFEDRNTIQQFKKDYHSTQQAAKKAAPRKSPPKNPAATAKRAPVKVERDLGVRGVRQPSRRKPEPPAVFVKDERHRTSSSCEASEAETLILPHKLPFRLRTSGSSGSDGPIVQSYLHRQASRAGALDPNPGIQPRPASFTNPFVPTAEIIQEWASQRAPTPFVPPPEKRSKTLKRYYAPSSDSEIEYPDSSVALMMRQNGAFPANGYSNHNNIVQEYMSPAVDGLYDADFDSFKGLSDKEKRDIIIKEAETYGMEKPKGYSVSFHYNPHVEYHHFGSSHPMKPWRLTLTKQLVLAYGLEFTMDLYQPPPATFEQLSQFHDAGYLEFLSRVTPQNVEPEDPTFISYGFGGESNDCPVFDGLWNYVTLYSNASLWAANSLTSQQSSIAINWSGGLHHAKKNMASGFCYINDIVLAIQQLLTRHQRVLYIDIDVHHGDGVEQAFESTDRVFTLSYHKFGVDKNGYPFFPGTGNITEIGPADPSNRGKGHCLNIPIEDGIDDHQYEWLFKTITGAVVEKYRPEAIVLQCGADSLGGDRLGRFNLNIKAHGFCIETVKNYGKPMLLIGGGGYTPRNVARTWCHETAVCVGAKLHNNLPSHLPYIQAFQGEENGGGIMYPDLHNTKRHTNDNTQQKLQNIIAHAMENLRYLEGAPSVVVNTVGITEDEIMKIREEVERELEEEREDRGMSLSVENMRRRRERNVGGRGERGLR